MTFCFRNKLQENDRIAIREILYSTRIFYDFEVDVALEIVDLFLKDGEKTGYYFFVAEQAGKIAGYVNFGPTPCTKSSWDIYWIAVRKDIQGEGLGSILLKMAEEQIASLNGKNIWIETSSRSDYLPTRKFYIKACYDRMCALPDFYGVNDHKVIFRKHLE